MRLHLGYDGKRWGYATQEQWRRGDKEAVRSIKEVCGSTKDASVTTCDHDWPLSVEEPRT